MSRSVLAWLLIVGVALTASGRPVTARLSGEVSASLGRGDFMPRVRQQVLPSYPAVAISGAVEAEVVVGTNGRVAHARVAKSADPTGALDRTCLAALDQWRFEPAMDYGQPAATIVLVRFTYAAPSAGFAEGSVSAQLEPVLLEPPPETPGTIDPAVPVAGAKGSGISWPVAIRSIKPSYTPEGMRAKTQGIVGIELVVLADGTVGAARVVKSLERSLDWSALIAARYWFFAPATLNGVPVASKVPMQLEFRLH
jgi:TonB family protein